MAGLQRVAVGVQAGDRHAGALEHAQEVIASSVTKQGVVKGWHVHGWLEPVSVDLDAGQADIGDHPDRLP